MLTKEKMINRCISLMLVCLLLFSRGLMSVEAGEISNRDRIIVSLGDSYSSGEGIEPFYGSDKELAEKVKDLDWLSHRSVNSWPGMLRIPKVDGTMAENRNNHWYFAAVSGAKIKHVVSKSQKKTYVKHYTKTGNAYRGGKKAVVATYSDTIELDKQIDIFDQLKKEGKKADYVTITIGGNDADFGGIITKIVTGSAFLDISGLSNKIYDTWGEFYKEGGIRDQLREAYNIIAEEAGPQATILVAGYPRLLNKNGNGSVITQKEAEIVNRAVTLFNYAIQDVVKECCVQDEIDIHFVSVEEEFGDNGAYTDKSTSLINEVIFPAQEEDINDSKITSDYSMHPNYRGACTYANCVQKKINKLESSNSGNLSSEKIYGQWFNDGYDHHEAWATSYKVTFNEDGTVIHEGYRQTNKGVYTVFEELGKVVAIFSENYHVYPGEGKVKEDYTFEVVYEIVDEGLYANYSEYPSNAQDGLFVRNSKMQQLQQYEQFLKDNAEKETFYSLANIGSENSLALLIAREESAYDFDGENVFSACDVYYYVDGDVRKLGTFEGGTRISLAIKDDQYYLKNGLSDAAFFAYIENNKLYTYEFYDEWKNSGIICEDSLIENYGMLTNEEYKEKSDEFEFIEDIQFILYENE